MNHGERNSSKCSPNIMNRSIASGTSSGVKVGAYWDIELPLCQSLRKDRWTAAPKMYEGALE